MYIYTYVHIYFYVEIFFKFRIAKFFDEIFFPFNVLGEKKFRCIFTEI